MASDTLVAGNQSLRLAPADREPGHRGVRGRAAGVVSLLSLVALSTSAWHGHGGGSSGTVQFTTDGWRGWAPTVFAVVAGALLLAATVLWKARTRRAIGLGVVVAAVAIAAGIGAAVIGQRFATVSASAFKAARLGTPRTVLEGRLGAPYSTHVTDTQRRSGETIPCDLYRGETPAGAGGYFFCFRNGVLAAKSIWDAPL